MRKEDIKYIEPKEDFVTSLQDFVLAHSNAGLISLELHRECVRFQKTLCTIPLSDEFQNLNALV